MNLEPKLNYLIHAYIAEVSINLPRKKRNDIVVEIHSLILDALEDQAQSRLPDEEMVMTVLRELGSPVDMAARYSSHNYVIGPKLYAPFVVTVRGTLIFMAFFYLLGLAISWNEATASLSAFGSTIWGLAMAFFKNAVQNISVVLLVFMLLEKVLPDQNWFDQIKAWAAISEIPILRQLFGRSTPTQTWNPDELTITPKVEPVRRGEVIFVIALVILVMILFNFFPHLVGIYGYAYGTPWHMPVLAASSRIYLPWWNIYWLLTLGVHFGALARGRWTHLLQWLEAGVMVFSGGLAYWMLVGPDVIGFNPEFLAFGKYSIAEGTIIPILRTFFDIALVMHLIIKVPTLLAKISHIVGKSPRLVWKPRV